MNRVVCGLLLMFSLSILASAQQPPVAPPMPLPVGKAAAKAPAKKYGRGHIPPKVEVSAGRHRISTIKHGAQLKALPVITAAKWDCRTLGQCGAVHNQAQCGDCYIFSGTEVCEDALYVAGLVKAGSGFGLSQQYFLDCQNVGGCSGGDEYQIAQMIQSSGCPSNAQYGGDGQSPGSCKSTSGMTLYTITNLGMCSNTTGVANTQDIKNCMAAYGPISVAVAAGDDWDSYQPGTILTGRSTDVNHAVLLVGWDDTTNPPSWICQNSWGTAWGNGGYCSIAYGADSIGAEAFWVQAAAPVPPPVTTPTITSALAATGTVGMPFNYQITASNSPTAFGAIPLPAGLTLSTTGLISGIPTTAGTTQTAISAVATGSTSSATAMLTITIAAAPTPPVAPVFSFTITSETKAGQALLFFPSQLKPSTIDVPALSAGTYSVTLASTPPSPSTALMALAKKLLADIEAGAAASQIIDDAAAVEKQAALDAAAKKR